MCTKETSINCHDKLVHMWLTFFDSADICFCESFSTSEVNTVQMKIVTAAHYISFLFFVMYYRFTLIFIAICSLRANDVIYLIYVIPLFLIHLYKLQSSVMPYTLPSSPVHIMHVVPHLSSQIYR